MPKDVQAACPVCGQEVNDPDFDANRNRRAVLKCANCRARLEWQPLWLGYSWLGH